MEELWKDVVGYEGRYQVSSLGRVRSVTRIVNRPMGSTRLVESKILSLQKSNLGYLRIILIDKNHKAKTCSVHRLVALAFIPNPNNFPMVNHKDENKENNFVENLEWCDAAYNVSYGTAIQRRSEKRRRKVEMIDKYSGKVLKVFDSVQEASKETGISRQLITDVCMKRPKKYTAGGYIWRYADSDVRAKRNVGNDIRMLNKYPEKRKIEMIDKNTNSVLKTFNSLAEASKVTHISKSTIFDVCNNRQYKHTAGGYKWRYAD